MIDPINHVLLMANADIVLMVSGTQNEHIYQ